MRTLCMLLLTTCCCAFSQAYAGNDDYLETIVVTASRTPVSIAEAGSAVTVIDREEIDRRQASFVSDLLRDVPGLAVSQSGGAGKFTQIRVRGAEANHVLVLIDGIEANDISQDDAFDFAHLSAADIERIEVIRGPQSALWGSDALAGVINVITRRADSGYRAEGSLEAGSFGTRQAQVHVGQSSDRHHIRIGMSYYNTDGTNIARVGSEEDGYRNTTFTLNSGVQPTDTFKLSLTGRVTDIENQSDAIDFFTTGLPADADRRTDTFQAYTGARAQFDPFDGRWTHALAANWTLGANKNLADGAFTGRTRGDKYKIDYQTTVRFPIRVLFDSEHAATFAVDYEDQRFEQRGPIGFFGNPNQNREIDTIGYVGEYRISFAGGAAVSGSVRHDDNSDFQDVTTYRGAFSYTLGYSDTTFEAAYATGQKAPTFADRFGYYSTVFIGPPFVGNSNLKPETSKGWEVGLYQPLLADRLILGAMYFKEKLEDEINGFVFDPALGAFTAENMNGTSRRQGVELTARGRITERLSIKGSYTYLDTTELDAANRRIDEVRRPRHQGGVEIAYSFAGGKGQVDLHLTHTGEQQDTFFAPFPAPASRVTLSDFNLLGLTSSFRVTDNVTLFGRMENMLDETYEEVLGFRAPGFSAFAGVRITTSSN